MITQVFFPSQPDGIWIMHSLLTTCNCIWYGWYRNTRKVDQLGGTSQLVIGLYGFVITCISSPSSSLLGGSSAAFPLLSKRRYAKVTLCSMPRIVRKVKARAVCKRESSSVSSILWTCSAHQELHSAAYTFHPGSLLHIHSHRFAYAVWCASKKSYTFCKEYYTFSMGNSMHCAFLQKHPLFQRDCCIYIYIWMKGFPSVQEFK